MKFKILAVVALLVILIPAALVATMLAARASASAPREGQEFSNPLETSTVVSEGTPPSGQTALESQVRAAWSVDIPTNMRSGRLALDGTLEINPDPARGREEISIMVLVEDPETGNVLDSRDHGVLNASPSQRYRRAVEEKFDLPPGTYRIRFLAAYANAASVQPDGSTAPAVVAETTGVVTVD